MRMRILRAQATTLMTKRIFLLICASLFGFSPFLPAQDTSLKLPALPNVTDPKNLAVKGHDGWLFLPAEIRHLATATNDSASTGENDPVPAILDFNSSLARKGILLVIVPVPEKSLIRADKLFPAPDVAAAAGYWKASGRYIEALKKNGVDVMDTRLMLTAEAARTEMSGDPVYCRTDTHFTPRTTVILAQAIASHIREIKPDVVGKAGGGFVRGPLGKLAIQGDLAPPGTTEELGFQGVLKSEDMAATPVSDTTSPVLLLGDSHCLVFHAGGDMLAKGGGLADNLAVELGSLPDVMAVRGSGATAVRVNLYRKAHKDPEFLKNKKIVVWCFASREFTQSDGWKIVPLP